MEIRHVPGKDTLVADYNSRNPIPCENRDKCQLCNYAFSLQDHAPANMFIARITVDEMESRSASFPFAEETSTTAFIARVTVDDIESGSVRIPFSERPSWIKIQEDDLVHKQLKDLILNGQTPVKKKTGKHFTLLKRLFNLYKTNLLSIAKDGLITIRHVDPKIGDFQAILVPANIFPGLIQSLHITLDHPTTGQLEKLVHRSFYCLNSHGIISEVTSTCSRCSSLSILPKELMQQTTEKNPVFGANYAADVIKQNEQLIFLCREKLSQHTFTKIILDEKSDSLREALIAAIAEILPETGGTVRVDPGPSLRYLAKEAQLDNDSILKRLNVEIDVGRVHNPNKNPIAENAVKEFEKEKLRISPQERPVSELERILITRNMNRRIRESGFSAKEILLRRDLITNQPKNISDEALADSQLDRRKKQQDNSIKREINKDAHGHKFKESKDGANLLREEAFVIGDRVFIKDGLSKTKAREPFWIKKLYTKNSQKWATIQKMNYAIRNVEYEVKTQEIYKVPFENYTRHEQKETYPKNNALLKNKHLENGKTDKKPNNEEKEVEEPVKGLSLIHI